MRGDIRKQEFCPHCHVPHYFYTDQEKVCVQCGKPFIFSASEQKYWYESLKFHFDSVAIRCVDCRRKRRSEKALCVQLGETVKRLKADPDDPVRLLALAEAIVRYRQRTGRGSLNEAIAAARKSVKKGRSGGASRGPAEALFWEACCHALTERRERARHLFQRFLQEAPGGQRFAPMIREAKAWTESV